MFRELCSRFDCFIISKKLFFSLKNNVYKFIDQKRTWNEAEAACNTFGAGHHLVSIQVRKGAIIRGRAYMQNAQHDIGYST